MGVYIVMGGSSGIGAHAVALLRQRGDEVCNLALGDADINVDLCKPESRSMAIEELHRRYPDGIDGLICNAGALANEHLTPADVLSINYFGAIAVAQGCFDLLLKKKGACVVTVSASLSFYQRGKYDVTDLLNNDGNEPRIRSLVDTFDRQEAGPAMYINSKYALARWVKRTAPSWGKKGVRLNAMGPGSCATRLTEDMTPEAFEFFVLGLPMPLYYDAKCHQDPADPAKTLVFLASPESAGINGQLIFCDGGTDGLMKTENFLG